MPSALAQLSEERAIAHFRFRTWSRQLLLSLPRCFRACALMAVLLFAANSARSWGGATTDGFSGTNAQRHQISRVSDRPPRTCPFSASFDAPMGL